jgi:hypothetical protein
VRLCRGQNIKKFEVRTSLEAETSEMIILVMMRFGILLSNRFEFQFGTVSSVRILTWSVCYAQPLLVLIIDSRAKVHI